MVSKEDGIARRRWDQAVLAYVGPTGVWVVMENHCKDPMWTYPSLLRQVVEGVHGARPEPGKAYRDAPMRAAADEPDGPGGEVVPMGC